VAKGFFKFVSVSLMLSGAVVADCTACLSSNLSLEASVPMHIKKCDDYVKSENEDHLTLSSLWTSSKKWVSPNDRPTYSKFEIFNDFDFIRKTKANYRCERTAFLYVGVKHEKEQKICHIAWEPHDATVHQIHLHLLQELGPGEYDLFSYAREEVAGKFGSTVITKRKYCHKSGDSTLTHIRVIGPSIDLDELEFENKKLADKVRFPLQHVRIERKSCDPD